MTRKSLMLALILLAGAASAHTGAGAAGGAVGGLSHPVLAPDHLALLVAAGIWGGYLGGAALWVLPVIFPLFLAGGATLASSGLVLPAADISTAMSGIVLGLLILFAVQPPLPVSAFIAGLAAVFLGQAHSGLLSVSPGVIAFTGGFVVATLLLPVGGALFGLLSRISSGEFLVRATGGAIAAAGVYFLSIAMN